MTDYFNLNWKDTFGKRGLLVALVKDFKQMGVASSFCVWDMWR